MSDWEGGTRQGVRWRRLGIGVTVIALLAGAYYGMRNDNGLAIDTDNEPAVDVSEIVDIVVTAPLNADDTWYCPSTHPVRAYADGGRYYPEGFPTDPGDVDRPDECYDTAERAEAAGYDAVPPPDGTVLIDGLYVEPTRSPSVDDCRDLARTVGFTVPCPRRLPAPADGPPCGERLCVFPGPDSLTERRPRHPGVVIQHDGFSVPSQVPWVGVARDVVVSAVAVDEYRDDGTIGVKGPEEFVSCFPESGLKPEGRRVFRTCVDAKPWVPGFGGFPLEGHTSAIWTRGDVVYAAGVVGAGDHIEALLAAVIDGIEYVEPPS